ncbi:hypothetical protein PCANC_20185 [Puccinia coronata f. sp. avenae]|uniref:Uncharacterized protein n=1 Tax=Puccinia coronata f. sp. avenae TaxID=200324 RepID=A0A2N5TW41_9BASI|nr:hypothetical protein PCASD_12333 [Puccinia coronata f. sp. avenae]PLW29705.1 hypothetical protein PCANC_20185 [Puccinia coronata f. sp. avenae]PLW47804.1 hypothetical protein PCASD_04364 [Puccinia coronata f. sp. avenae]
MPNDTLPASNQSASSILVDPGPIYNSYTVGYFFIGFLITITASILNAFGINLQKLDLNKQSNSTAPKNQHTLFRPIWLLGLGLYILSQVLGSTLALQYMRSEYVAPLGSASLIFNFLFARWLLGTQITTLDALGTLVVILGVVGVIGFGNIRQAGIDEEANMSLSTLKALWARPAWIIHLIALEIITSLVLWLANIGYEIIEEKRTFETSRISRDEEDTDVEMVLRRGGGRKSQSGLLARTLLPILSLQQKFRTWLKNSIERWSSSRADQSMMKLDGLLWGCSAGLLAGQTLIFAKSYVKLVSNGLDHHQGEPKDLAHPLSILILILLILTGVLQVWCLNRGLKVYDSTLIVPVLFATYTGSGFINSLIYLHELPHYRTSVLLMIWLCMGVLVIGVCMLSAKRVDGNKTKPIGEYSSTADPEGEVQQTAIGQEEAVGMVMIHSERPIKKRQAPSIHSQVPELSECSLAESSLSRRSSGVVKLNHLQHPSHSNSHPGLNPFDDFEILTSEELPEDHDQLSSDQSDAEDEIDRLQDNHNGYFRPPHLKPDDDPYS